MEDQGQKVNWRKVLGGPGSFKVSGGAFGGGRDSREKAPNGTGVELPADLLGRSQG